MFNFPPYTVHHKVLMQCKRFPPLFLSIEILFEEFIITK